MDRCSTSEAGRAALQEEIQSAMRRVELAEARVAGLIRAQLAEQPVLWCAHDAERQQVFDEAFTAGRTLLKSSGEAK